MFIDLCRKTTVSCQMFVTVINMIIIIIKSGIQNSHPPSFFYYLLPEKRLEKMVNIVMWNEEKTVPSFRATLI